MGNARTVSIIITSYNYARFLPFAIESALTQSYSDTEVIVVDDGSVDESRAIIATYGDQVISVLKENGGQASSFNEGFRASRGEIILFLDSDDALLPDAVETTAQDFDEKDVVKVHWPLWEIDEFGKRTGRIIPGSPLSEGNFHEAVIVHGPDGYSWPPTSGNAWARSFIERVFPMPEPEFKTCPDLFLCTLAPLYGLVRRAEGPKSMWRAHGITGSWHTAGTNNSQHQSFDQFALADVLREDCVFAVLEDHCRAMAIKLDVGAWKSTWRRLLWLSIRDIAMMVPSAHSFILVDDAQWGAGSILAGRRVLPFIERGGQYWGAPADDEVAIRELERMRQAGAGFIVFAWSSFWWLGYYATFHRYLRTHFSCALENDRVVIFDLRPSSGRAH
jgi:glycosyltransferase involved in cell wall biosynthesis